MEKEFSVKIILRDGEFCHGCPLMIRSENKDGSLKMVCNLFNKQLVYDVRRRVDRLQECLEKYGK
jgi:hypothetical protein